MKHLTEKEAFALASPSPFTLVTSLDKNRQPNILGVSWVTRISLDPCLMLVSIGHDRPAHEIIRQNNEFVINYPNPAQEEAVWTANLFADKDNDSMSKTGLKFVQSSVVKVPTIKDAVVAFECKVINSIPSGDHTAFIGKVVAMRGDKSKIDNLDITSMNGFFPGMKHLIQIAAKQN